MFVNFQKLPEESRIWVYGAENIISNENQELISDEAGLAYPIKDGIPVLLEDEARKF